MLALPVYAHGCALQCVTPIAGLSHLLHEAAQQDAGGHELDARGAGGFRVQPHRVPDAPAHWLIQQTCAAPSSGPGGHAPRLQHLRVYGRLALTIRFGSSS